MKHESGKIEATYRNSESNKNENSAGRIFLQHFRILNLSKLKTIKVLKEDEKLLTKIKIIDSTPVKDCIKSPLFYFKDCDSMTYETNMANADPYFNDFLSSLGTIVDEPHIRTGNFEHLRDLITNAGIVYSANYCSELVFVCPSLKPAKKLTKVLFDF